MQTSETRVHKAAPGLASDRPQRWRRLLRLQPPTAADVATDLENESWVPLFWFRVALILLAVGALLEEPFLLAVASALLVFIAVAWAWNALIPFQLHYRRSFSETRAFLGETITLTLAVHNRKPIPLSWLEVIDTFPTNLPLDGVRLTASPGSNLGEYLSFWRPGPYQRLTRTVTITCTQRGYYSFGPVTLKTGDGFGLFNRRLTLAERQYLIIYPRLYSAAELHLPSKSPFGKRGSQLPLFEDPLRPAGIREWEATDSLRRIHWKATARHQRLLSRRYEPSDEPQVMIYLNVATVTRYWEGAIPELLERAVSVAGSLAALAIEMRLPVGLLANAYWPGSDQVLRLLPGRRPDQLVRILELLAAVTPFAGRPVEELLSREAPRLPWSATLLVVTAVTPAELLVTLLALRQAGRQIALFTLAPEPPPQPLPGLTVYHWPHLIEDVIMPERVCP